MKLFSTRLPEELILWIKIKAAKEGKRVQDIVLELLKIAKGEK